MNKNVLVDVDIEVEFEDIVEYIENATKREKEQLSIYLYDKSDVDDEFLSYNNLYDREKFLILKKAMEKYNLEELIERLDIKQNET